jgi:hypothetical protein
MGFLAENFMKKEWKLIGHPVEIDGDYFGHYEITNGDISILTKDDNREALLKVVEALNGSGCEFYQNQDIWLKHENRQLKEEVERLRLMIDNNMRMFH